MNVHQALCEWGKVAALFLIAYYLSRGVKMADKVHNSIESLKTTVSDKITEYAKALRDENAEPDEVAGELDTFAAEIKAMTVAPAPPDAPAA